MSDDSIILYQVFPRKAEFKFVTQSKLKLATDNLLSIYEAANWETTERK